MKLKPEDRLPCPFCSNPKILLIGCVLTELYGDDMAQCWCDKCGGKGSQDTWNNRANVVVAQPPYAYAYIDDKNRLVKISGHVYFDGGFVDANSEIPDSWRTLVLVAKEGG